jgi:predicted ABC-type transport system involved in lysophospholipase L1 biosynthesis ATPase subunit
MNPIVEIRNVHKIYTRGSEKLDVLQGVTLQVASGEFLALMGAAARRHCLISWPGSTRLRLAK